MVPRFSRLVFRTLIVLVSGQCALGATFNIANGDVAGLINAINTVNTNNDNDTINLAAGGSYILTGTDNVTNGPTGLPVLTKDGSGTTGHTLTIDGHGA